MLFDDILFHSDAAGGVELVGTIKKISNPAGAALFSHNTSGSKDDPLFIELESVLSKSLFNTLRYNFHYVGKFPPGDAKFEDLQKDFDAAYSKLLEVSDVVDFYFIGKSMGSVVSMKYLLENRLRNPIIVLGYYRQAADKYIPIDLLKTMRAPLLVIHGEYDQHCSTEDLRTYFNQAGVTFDLKEIKGADHGFLVREGSERSQEEINSDIISAIVEFINKN